MTRVPRMTGRPASSSALTRAQVWLADAGLHGGHERAEAAFVRHGVERGDRLRPHFLEVREHHHHRGRAARAFAVVAGRHVVNLVDVGHGERNDGHGWRARGHVAEVPRRGRPEQVFSPGEPFESRARHVHGGPAAVSAGRNRVQNPVRVDVGRVAVRAGPVAAQREEPRFENVAAVVQAAVAQDRGAVPGKH